MKFQRAILKIVLALAVLLLPIGAQGTERDQSFGAEAKNYSTGTGAAAALSNVVYLPAKVVLAVGGAVTSGLAYVVTLGNERATREIWDTSTGGDYIVTPAMIAGDRRVRFTG